jgi:hypothetical protein
MLNKNSNFKQYKCWLILHFGDVPIDLGDCDRIFRIKSSSGNIHPPCLIELLKDFGFNAKVLAYA